MLHVSAISIFLLQIVTVSGTDFWKDVDALEEELSDPRNLPTTQVPINETQQVQSSESMYVQTGYSKNYEGRVKTLDHKDLYRFCRAIKIDKSYPKNVSTKIIEGMVLKLEDNHKWPELHLYNEDEYFNYWARVCMFFWDDPLVNTQRHACRIKTNTKVPTSRKILIGTAVKHVDVLCCRCVHYKKMARYPLAPPEFFQIHKSSDNVFILFEPKEKTNYRMLVVKGLRSGITLPNPDDFNY